MEVGFYNTILRDNDNQEMTKNELDEQFYADRDQGLIIYNNSEEGDFLIINLIALIIPVATISLGSSRTGCIQGG